MHLYCFHFLNILYESGSRYKPTLKLWFPSTEGQNYNSIYKSSAVYLHNVSIRRNLAVLPVRKDSESQSNMFCSVCVSGGGLVSLCKAAAVIARRWGANFVA